MEVYLVGGAVRDQLLGRPVRERDWVVVGATPEEMIRRGFRPVGRDFPVFLHPETGEEYALARTERKTAPGYRGFAVHAAPDVTLEEDLARRDLTINAMARDAAGRIIDPYGGRRDLEARILRHVSPAFVEDPVRILRVARFLARYAPLGFRIADETLALMREMVARGEVDALVPERVWAELAKALAEPAPQAFLQALRACGALARILPEVDRLYGVPQPPEHHPEVDCGLHTELVLAQAARLSDDPRVRFAALVHDLGKGTTPPARWPAHHGHEVRGARLVERLCTRLRAPREYRDEGMLAARLHGRCHDAPALRPATLLDTLERLDALRRPERLERFVLACEADARGRTGLEDRPYPQADYLRGAREAAAAVSPHPLLARGLRGPELGAALRLARLRALAAYRRTAR
ncbi:multifunctional CCA addition/repair protein [Inmirania thermothiophila]|uniref:Multifunctional CCA protein n=1 Tax=Inmirania thermothiophila TaxID=1750597 RepID=A0A3N1Y6Y0_9GAMM|nr:multifunctional CCA addition/repair protein [Inmirania thermothiophila]ROR34525.1 tRNA nucleotidyltransferase (CCA-adding enzyme) [Inmirania thermothiophila]